METDPSPVRPTKSVVVRALCDMLRPVIRGLTVLDLFAGTGRIGEALLDEGAGEVVSVDKRSAPESIPDEMIWIQRDVSEYVQNGPHQSFDVIYMDPSYKSTYPEELLPQLADSNWVNDEGIVVVETDTRKDLPEEIGRLMLMRKRKYGRTLLWIYQADRDEPGYQS